MAQIRINNLPLENSPSSSENLAIDGSSTRRATIQNVVLAGRPSASQAEAEAGTDPIKAMTPLTVKQSIAIEVGQTLASSSQGIKADGALQRSGGPLTGAVTAADGGLIQSANWLLNDVRNYGAVRGVSSVQDAAFTAAKDADQIRVPRGGWRLSDGYDLSTHSVWYLDHGAYLTNAAGNPSTAGILYLQIAQYVNSGYEMEARSGGMVITPTRRIKLEYTPISISTWGDETVLFDAQLWYQRTATGVGTGYAGGGSVVSLFVNYGPAEPASGSHALIVCRANIHDVKAEPLGRSEHTPITVGNIAMADRFQYKSNFYIDFVACYPKLVQEAFATVVSMAAKKLNPVRTRDVDHDGASLFVAETNPLIGGYAAPMETTYAMNAGGIISGWAGPVATTSGYDAAATSAFDWALFLGGAGGVWTPYGAHSKFDHGIGITDYVFSGIDIFTAHPAAVDPFAIRVFEDAGRFSFGVNSPGAEFMSVGAGFGQFQTNIMLAPSRDATSQRSSLSWNGQWFLNTDTNGNGTEDFALYHSATGINVMTVSTTDKIMVRSLNIALVPTSASGLSTGDIWRSGNQLMIVT